MLVLIEKHLILYFHLACAVCRDIFPTPSAKVVFLHCCKFCSRAPRCPGCFCRRAKSARCGPWSALWARLCSRNSNICLLPPGASTTGTPAAPGLYGVRALGPILPDCRQKGLWIFFLSWLSHTRFLRSLESQRAQRVLLFKCRLTYIFSIWCLVFSA